MSLFDIPLFSPTPNLWYLPFYSVMPRWVTFHLRVTAMHCLSWPLGHISPGIKEKGDCLNF